MKNRGEDFLSFLSVIHHSQSGTNEIADTGQERCKSQLKNWPSRLTAIDWFIIKSAQGIRPIEHPFHRFAINRVISAAVATGSMSNPLERL